MPTNTSSNNQTVMGQSVNGEEPMEYVKVDDAWWLSHHGTLPPVEERTEEREGELKKLHGSDVRALGTPGAEASQDWSPVGSDASGLRSLFSTSTETDDVEALSNYLSKTDAPPQVSDEPLDMGSVFSTTTEAEDIEALSQYASKLDANALEGGQQEAKEEEKDPLKLKLSNKKKRKYESDVRTGESKTEKNKSLDKTAEYTFFDKKWEVHEQKDEEGIYQNHIRVFGAHSKVTANAGTFTENGKTIRGAKGQAVLGGSLLDWKNKWTGGPRRPVEANVDVVVGKLEGKASGEATINTAEGEAALKGSLGIEAILYEITVGGKVSIVPARWVDAACDHKWLDNWSWSADLCRMVETDEYDYGITIGGSAGVMTGGAAKAEGGFEKKNGKIKFGGKTKISVGAGGTIGGDIEAGKIGR